jgi:hypothetical protein
VNASNAPLATLVIIRHQESLVKISKAVLEKSITAFFIFMNFRECPS